VLRTGTSGGSYEVFNSSTTGPTSAFSLSSVDVAFFQWKNAFGWPLEIWLGRFGGIGPGPNYPIHFGPFGLLMNTSGGTYSDSVSGFRSIDGLRIALSLSKVSDLRLQGVWSRVVGATGPFTYPSGEDMYGADVNVKLFEGFRLGAYYVGNTIAQAGSSPFTGPSPLGVLYHLYGPRGGSLNPGAAVGTPPFTAGLGGLRCITTTGSSAVAGINCPALGNGWGAYVNWDIRPGIHLDVEAAQWSDTTLGGGTDSGYNAVVTWNLARLVGWKGVIVTTGYQYYGPNFYPPYGAPEPDFFAHDVFYPGNAQGFAATSSWAINPTFTVFANYLTGNHVNNSQPFLEWNAGVAVNLAPNSRITFQYRDIVINGTDQLNFYRAQFDYRF
jgi:hypothetical protein